MSFDDLHIAQGPQRPPIDLLANGLRRIRWRRRQGGREILRPDNLIGGERLLGERHRIQPTQGCRPDGPVVEIETIDVEPRTHGLKTMQGRLLSETAPRPVL